MNPILSLIVTLAMSLLPALLFIGLFNGLRSMQTTSNVSSMNSRMDEDLKEVTLSEATRSVFDGDSFLPQSTESNTHKSNISKSSDTSQNRCSVCGANNDYLASYCHNCTSKM
jgi:hypothetical protein